MSFARLEARKRLALDALQMRSVNLSSSLTADGKVGVAQRSMTTDALAPQLGAQYVKTVDADAKYARRTANGWVRLSNINGVLPSSQELGGVFGVIGTNLTAGHGEISYLNTYASNQSAALRAHTWTKLNVDRSTRDLMSLTNDGSLRVKKVTVDNQTAVVPENDDLVTKAWVTANVSGGGTGGGGSAPAPSSMFSAVLTKADDTPSATYARLLLSRTSLEVNDVNANKRIRLSEEAGLEMFGDNRVKRVRVDNSGIEVVDANSVRQFQIGSAGAEVQSVQGTNTWTVLPEIRSDAQPAAGDRTLTLVGSLVPNLSEKIGTWRDANGQDHDYTRQCIGRPDLYFNAIYVRDLFASNNTIHVGSAALSSNTDGTLRLPLGSTMEGVPIGSMRIRGTVADEASLPNSGVELGDCYFVGENMYSASEIDPVVQWHNIGVIRGPQGYAGRDGVDGSLLNTFRGAWDAAATYARGDIVYYDVLGDGSSWVFVSTTANSQVAPQSETSANWAVLMRGANLQLFATRVYVSDLVDGLTSQVSALQTALESTLSSYGTVEQVSAAVLSALPSSLVHETELATAIAAVTADLTQYATVESVAAAIAQLATQSALDALATDVATVSATLDALQASVAALETNAATKAELANYALQTSIAGLATSAAVAETYATKMELETGLADKLTMTDAAAGFATQAALMEVEAQIPDVSGLAARSELAPYALTSDLTALSSQFAAAADLANYATLLELSAVQESIPTISGLATQEALTAVQSTIPSISGLATLQEVEAMIPDTSVYATIASVQEAVGNVEAMIPDPSTFVSASQWASLPSAAEEVFYATQRPATLGTSFSALHTGYAGGGAVTRSGDGRYAYFGIFNSAGGRQGIWRSEDGGQTFANVMSSLDTVANLCMSVTNRYVYANCMNVGRIYRSADTGATFQAVSVGSNASSMTCSSSGQWVFVTDFNSSGLYVSQDYGVTFTKAVELSGGLQIINVALAERASAVYFGSNSNGYIYRYRYDTQELTQSLPGTSTYNCTGLACSDDGQYCYASYYTVSTNQVAVSSDHGASWTMVTIVPASGMDVNFVNVACSRDGRVGYVANVGQHLYVSTNYGSSWNAVEVSGRFNGGFGISMNVPAGNSLCLINGEGFVLSPASLALVTMADWTALDARIPDASQFARTSDLADYATTTQVAAVEAQIPDVSMFATTTQVAAVEAQIPDVSMFATTTQLAAVEVQIPDVSMFATTTQVAAVEAQIPDVSMFATTTQVAAVEAQIPDVSMFATTTQLATVEAQIPDVSMFATTTQLAAVEAQIPDVSMFATTTQVAAVEAQIPDMTDVVHSAMLSDYATTAALSSVQASIPNTADFVTASDLTSYVQQSDLPTLADTLAISASGHRDYLFDTSPSATVVPTGVFSRVSTPLYSIRKLWVSPDARIILGIDGDGLIIRSDDFGQSYISADILTNAGSIAADAAGKQVVAVSLETTFPKISTNFGQSFTNFGPGTSNVNDVAMSDDGRYILFVCNDTIGSYRGHVFVSANYGASFSAITDIAVYWRTCTMSASGQYQIIGSMSLDGTHTYVRVSANYGATFTTVYDWTDGSSVDRCAMSADGACQVVCLNNGACYLSRDYGATFAALTSPPVTFKDIQFSGTGDYAVALSANHTSVYWSTNGGNSWTLLAHEPALYLHFVKLSRRGNMIVLMTNIDQLMVMRCIEVPRQPVAMSVRNTSEDMTLDAATECVLVSGLAAATNITTPPHSRPGQRWMVIDTDGSAATYPLSIVAGAGQTLDGSTAMTDGYQAIQLVAVGDTHFVASLVASPNLSALVTTTQLSNAITASESSLTTAIQTAVAAIPAGVSTEDVAAAINTALADYLSQVDAAATYLDSTTAATTYLSQVDAAATYLDSTTAATTYLSQVDAAATYLNSTTAATTYLSQVDAEATYLDSTTAATTYLTQAAASGLLDSTTAASTYLSQVDAAATYLDSTTASTTYLTQAAASGLLDSTTAASTYLSQVNAAATYVTPTYNSPVSFVGNSTFGTAVRPAGAFTAPSVSPLSSMNLQTLLGVQLVQCPMELLYNPSISLTSTTGTITLNQGNGSVQYITTTYSASGTPGYTLALTVPTVSAGSCTLTFTLVFNNTGSTGYANLPYCNAITVNGTSYTLRIVGGPPVTPSSQPYMVVQSFSILYLAGSIVSTVLSNVAAYL